MAKIIGIADCNNFYVSCERVFDPSLRNKPVLVLTNNDGSAIARSQEAKDLGIRKGEKIYGIKELIDKENVRLFSSNYTLYADMSERVVQAIRHFIPVVEVYSIDEVFMDLDHVEPENLEGFLLHVKEKVRQWTGIPISIGAAPTKTLAKLANKMAKDGNGVHCIINPDSEIDPISDQMDLEDVWGLGGKSVDKLEAIGCESIQDFVNVSPEWVRKNLTVVGLRTQKELKGEQCIPLVTEFKPRKNVSTARTFGRSTSDFLEVQKAVHLYTEKAVGKMKAESLSAGYVILHLSNDRHKEDVYYSRNFSIRFLKRESDFGEIWPQVQKLLLSEFRKEIRYRKAGISFGDLCPIGSEQMSLFQEKIVSHEVKEPVSTNWKMRREFLSKNFTTSWDELPEVNKIIVG